MGSVNDNSISSCAYQHFDSVKCIGFHTYCSCNEKSSLRVFRCDRIVLDLHEVLICNKADELEVIIHYRKFLYLALSEDSSSVLQTDSFLGRNQIFLGHHLEHRLLLVVLETEVTVSNDSYEFSIQIDNRNATDVMFRHKSQCIAHCSFRADGDRIINHPVLSSLYATDLFALLLNCHVFVDDTDTTCASHCDCKVSLSDGIHSRRHDWSTESNISSELSGDIYRSWKNFRACRYK